MKKEKKDLKLQRRQNPALTYPEFFAHLKMRYGRDCTYSLRDAWARIALPASGKVNGEVWNIFETNWKTHLLNLPEVQEEEAQRVLMSRLPAFITNWIIKEQYKRNARDPKVGL